MVSAEQVRIERMRTGEISFQLRIWAERIRLSQPKKYDLLTKAADRLDELSERVAIMSEPTTPTDEELQFPPNDDEIEGD